MTCVINRGTARKPKWYVKFKDERGKWRMRASHQPTKEQARRFGDELQARIRRGQVGIVEPSQEPPVRELMEQWLKGLRNRNAQDNRTRWARHVMPRFGDKRISEIDLPELFRWIDDQRAEGRLAEPSIRHNLNLLSRFFAWAIARGHAEVNPVQRIPVGRRPRQTPKRDTPFLGPDDEPTVLKIFEALPEPFDLMFYLGNRSGLRTGEISGLRMSDLDGMEHPGSIMVRYSYDGPLKEDRGESAKVKRVPAPVDARLVLGPWLDRRRAEGAGPECYVFPCESRGGSYHRPELIRDRWKKAAAKVGCSLTWYQATRHSFTTRSIKAGASLDDVSSALGHSSPVVTRRYYDHHIPDSFSSTLRMGLPLRDQDADNEGTTPPPHAETGTSDDAPGRLSAMGSEEGQRWCHRCGCETAVIDDGRCAQCGGVFDVTDEEMADATSVVIDTVPPCRSPRQDGEWVIFPTDGNAIEYAGNPGPEFVAQRTDEGFRVKGTLRERDTVMKGWRVVV